MESIPMSREGYDKFVKDLEYLKTTKRREIAEDIARARELGLMKREAIIVRKAKKSLTAVLPSRPVTGQID